LANGLSKYFVNPALANRLWCINARLAEEK
jgi:hypothetical protein